MTHCQDLATNVYVLGEALASRPFANDGLIIGRRGS